MKEPFNVTLTGAQDLFKLKAFLAPKLFQKAIRGGLSYAAKAGSVSVAKSIGSVYTLKAARIKQDIKGPFIRGDEATIIFSRKPPTALQYGARDPMKPGRGLTVAIIRGQRKPVARGFIVRSGRLAGMPFHRANNTHASPIHMVIGPSIGSIALGDSEFGAMIRAELSDRMNVAYIKGVERVLDSAARGYGS